MLPRMSGTLLAHGDCPMADLSQFSGLRYDNPKTDVDICNWHIKFTPASPEDMTFEKDVEGVNWWPMSNSANAS